ncbi:hypothetical protein [Luteolibacter sp. Populi]
MVEEAVDDGFDAVGVVAVEFPESVDGGFLAGEMGDIEGEFEDF